MKNRNTKLGLSLALLFSWVLLLGQGVDTLTNKRYAVNFAPGISHQDFAFENRFSPVPGSILTSVNLDQTNAKGWGTPLPVSIYDNDIGIGFKFNPILRYAMIYQDRFKPVGANDKWAFFADYHFSIYRTFTIKQAFIKKLFRNQSFYVGLGYSFLSPGLSYKAEYAILFKEPYKPRVIEGDVVYLDFQGFHAYIGIPVVKKVYFETLFMYVPEGQILYKAYWESAMLIFSVKYNLDIRFSSEK